MHGTSIAENMARRMKNSAEESAHAAPKVRDAALILLLVGVFYLGVVGLRIRQYNGNITALIFAGQLNAVHAVGFIGHDVVVIRNSNGYDGLAYYLIADDPFLQHPEVHAPFFYQRIGYPLVIWAVSLGQRVWRPVVMVAINIVAALAIAYLSMLIIGQFGRGASPWWALAAAINPSLIIGVEYDLAEPLVFALSLLGLLLYMRGRLIAATLTFAAALLTREVAILFILPLVAAEIGVRRWRRILLLALTVVPYLVWQIILAHTFGRVGAATSEGNLDLPLAGILTMLNEARHAGIRSAIVHEGSIIGVVIFIVAALVIAVLQVRRHYDVVNGGIITHAVAALFGGTAIWIAYGSAARVFGGIYPLTVFAYTRYRSPGFAVLAAGTILITFFTFIRLVVISQALPYYLTP